MKVKGYGSNEMQTMDGNQNMIWKKTTICLAENKREEVERISIYKNKYEKTLSYGKTQVFQFEKYMLVDDQGHYYIITIDHVCLSG